MSSSDLSNLQPGTSATLSGGAKNGAIAILIIFLVLLIDQTVKIWIKSNMTLGEQIPVIENLFYIHFTENYGMSFGLELGGSFGKLFLSVFRIFAGGVLVGYLYSLIKKDANKILIFSIALIIAGDFGNILDSAFYGLVFSESSPIDVATFLPEEGGYAGFLKGSVVDMFYFRANIEHVFWSKKPFNLSFPIFNIADSAITAGVVITLIFQRRLFTREEKQAVAIEEVKTGGTNTE
jgi:signal peptidase II